MSSSKPDKECGKKGKKEGCCAANTSVSKASAKESSAAVSGTSGKSITKVRTGGTGRGQQTSSIIITGVGLQPGPLTITPLGSPTKSKEDRSCSVNKSNPSVSRGQGTSSPNPEQNWSLKESILIREGQFTQGNEVYDVTTTEEEAVIQSSPGIDLPRGSPKEWYEEDEFNISPLKSDYGDLSGDGSDGTADLSPMDMDIDFSYVPYAGIDLDDSQQFADLPLLSFDDDYGLGVSPPSSPDGTPPLFSSPQYESPCDVVCASPTSISPIGQSPVRGGTPPSPRRARSSKEVEVQTGMSVPKTSSPSKIPSMKTSQKDTCISICSSKGKKSKTPDKPTRRSRRISIGTSVSPKSTQASKESREIQIRVPNTLITQPEITEHQEEHEVAPLKMDSPVGQIDVTTSLKMSRQTVGSPKGTIIEHSLVGTKAVSPGKAKQTEMTKKELLPPSPVDRRMEPSNYQISPYQSPKYSSASISNLDDEPLDYQSLLSTSTCDVPYPSAQSPRRPAQRALPAASGMRAPVSRLPAVKSGIRQPGAVGIRPSGAGGLRPPSGIRPPSTFGSASSSLQSSTCDVTCPSQSRISSPRMASPRTQYTAAVSPNEDVGQGVLPPEVALDRPRISSPRMQGPTAARATQAPREIPSVAGSSGMRPLGAGSRPQARSSGIRPPSQQTSKYEVTCPSKRASPTAPRHVPVGQQYARPGANANRPISLVNWKSEMQGYNQAFNASSREQHPNMQPEVLDPSLPEAYWSSSLQEARSLAEEADLPVISPSGTDCGTECPSTRRSPQRSSPARVPVPSAGPVLRPPSGMRQPTRMRPPTGMRPPGLQAPSGLRPPTGMRQPTGMRPAGVLRSPIASGRRSTSPQSECGVTCPSASARSPTPPRNPSPPAKEWYEADEYNISLVSFSDESGVSSPDALTPNYDINLDYSFANLNFSDGSIPGSLDDTDDDVSGVCENDLGYNLGFSEDEEDIVCPGSPGSPRAIGQRKSSPPYVGSRISPAQTQYSTQGRVSPAQYAQPRWLPSPNVPCISPIPSSRSPSPLGQRPTTPPNKLTKTPSPARSSKKSRKEKSGSKSSVPDTKALKTPTKKEKKSSPSKSSLKKPKSGSPTEPPIKSLYQRIGRAIKRPCSEGVNSARRRATSDRAASAPGRPCIMTPSSVSYSYKGDDELSKSVVDSSLLSSTITTKPYSAKSPPSPINLEIKTKVPKSACGADASIVKKLVDEEREDALVCKILMSPLKDKLGKHKKKPQAVKLLEETMNQSIPGDDDSNSFRSDIMAALMATEEKGIIDSTKSPKRTYETLFPPLRDEPVLAVSPAGPAPLQDIVVPVGDADMEDVALVNEDIRSTCASSSVRKMPSCDLYAESMARMKDDATEQKKTAKDEKQKEKQRLELRERSTMNASESPGNDGPYIPRGDLDEERAPWELNLDDLEEIVGGQMSTLQEDLPSDESIRAIRGRLEYILEYEKPLHYSCVQLQGSQSPNWFPGYYSVFPHTPNFVRLEKSPSRVMHVAWNIFAPSDVLDNSEVMISRN